MRRGLPPSRDAGSGASRSRGIYTRLLRPHVSHHAGDARSEAVHGKTVIEAALDLADAEDWRARPIRILDIGTGSGALLVTLLAELPLATGVGTDISDDALIEAARANAERLGVAGRATFRTGAASTASTAPFISWFRTRPTSPPRTSPCSSPR